VILYFASVFYLSNSNLGDTPMKISEIVVNICRIGATLIGRC